LKSLHSRCDLGHIDFRKKLLEYVELLETAFMKRPVAVLAVVFAAMASAHSVFADNIGVASAVKNDVTATLGGSSQPLTTGNSVFSNQRIRTGVASTAQLSFLDATSVSVAPQSELVLDRFVYNPSRGAGNVVLTTGRGAFRFVTGAQNPTNYTIKTPVATIGVRGTIVEIRNAMLNGVMVSVITLMEGSVQIRTRSGQTVSLTQPGMAYVVSADGSVRGPFNPHGSTFAYTGDPKRFDSPDNRLDLNDSLFKSSVPHENYSYCYLNPSSC
jgi:ferric-dicitrate binding protein FerR (iron transport regulator)